MNYLDCFRLLRFGALLLVVAACTYIDGAGETVEAGKQVEGKSGSQRICFLSVARNQAESRANIQVLASIREISELPDGYAFRYKGTDREITALIEFITFERKCCTFFAYGLVFESDEGSVWLHIRGGAGVKELFQQFLTPDWRNKMSTERPSSDIVDD